MREFRQVSAIGAGFTGKQIAAITALHNYIIKIFDIKPDTLEEAKKYIRIKIKLGAISLI